MQIEISSKKLKQVQRMKGERRVRLKISPERLDSTDSQRLEKKSPSLRFKITNNRSNSKNLQVDTGKKARALRGRQNSETSLHSEIADEATVQQNDNGPMNNT